MLHSHLTMVYLSSWLLVPVCVFLAELWVLVRRQDLICFYTLTLPETVWKKPLSYVPAPLLGTSHAPTYSKLSQETYGEGSSSIVFLTWENETQKRVTNYRAMLLSGSYMWTRTFCLHHHAAFLPEGSRFEPNTLRTGKYHTSYTCCLLLLGPNFPCKYTHLSSNDQSRVALE